MNAAQGMKAALKKVQEVDPFWKKKAIALIFEWLKTHDTVCSHDVFDLLPIPEGCHPSAWGTVFRHLDTCGALVRVGMKRGSKSGSHGRLSFVWAKRVHGVRVDTDTFPMAGAKK